MHTRTDIFRSVLPAGRHINIVDQSVILELNEQMTDNISEEVRSVLSELEPHGTHVERLPAGAFEESGTMVDTIIVRLERETE